MGLQDSSAAEGSQKILRESSLKFMVAKDIAEAAEMVTKQVSRSA
jgi:hypothetical protein